MIKIALKHWIYELCIEQLFTGIVKNFNTVPHKFKVGEHYNLIVVEQPDQYISMFGVKIIYVDSFEIHVNATQYVESDKNGTITHTDNNSNIRWAIEIHEIIRALK